MRKLLYCLTVISALCLPTFGFAEQFLCIADKASGFKHDESEWRAQGFAADNKYLVNFDKRTVNLFGESDTVHSNCQNYRHRKSGKQFFLCDEDFGRHCQNKLSCPTAC